MSLSEPASAITDLILGLVGLVLWARLRALPGVHRYWHLTLLWISVTALAGFVHHGFVTFSDTWDDPSWAIVTTMVVITVSYLLAATVIETLGPGRGRVFWVLRSLSLVAYVVIAATGNAGIMAILLSEGLTMLAVLGLWGRAALRHHPLAPGAIVAILASGAAGAVRAAPASVTEIVGLDPTSLYHLAQIPGVVLLYSAVAGYALDQRTAATTVRSRPADLAS